MVLQKNKTMEQVFFNALLFILEPIFKRWIKEALAEFQHQQVAQQNEPEIILTVQEAAQFLNLTVPTIYSKVSKGELPVMKRSKRLYFSSFELMAYIKEGRKKTTSEIAAEADNYLLKKQG